MPASASRGRSPAESAMAPPCENPASTMREVGMPRSFSRAISASTSSIEPRMPSAPCFSRTASPLMSYHARIGIPLFTVTGRTGACGKTKRTPGHAASTSSGTIGAKSLPSAPRPCNQMTDHEGDGRVSFSTVGRGMVCPWCAGQASYQTTPCAGCGSSSGSLCESLCGSLMWELDVGAASAAIPRQRASPRRAPIAAEAAPTQSHAITHGAMPSPMEPFHQQGAIPSAGSHPDRERSAEQVRYEAARVARDAVAVFADADACGFVADHPGTDQRVPAVEDGQGGQRLVYLQGIAVAALTGFEHHDALTLATPVGLRHDRPGDISARPARRQQVRVTREELP